MNRITATLAGYFVVVAVGCTSNVTPHESAPNAERGSLDRNQTSPNFPEPSHNQRVANELAGVFADAVKQSGGGMREISIEYSNGRATLSGTVTSTELKAMIVSAVSDHEYVDDVIDNLSVGSK